MTSVSRMYSCHFKIKTVFSLIGSLSAKHLTSALGLSLGLRVQGVLCSLLLSECKFGVESTRLIANCVSLHERRITLFQLEDPRVLELLRDTDKFVLRLRLYLRRLD